MLTARFPSAIMTWSSWTVSHRPSSMPTTYPSPPPISAPRTAPLTVSSVRDLNGTRGSTRGSTISSEQTKKRIEQLNESFSLGSKVTRVTKAPKAPPAAAPMPRPDHRWFRKVGRLSSILSHGIADTPPLDWYHRVSGASRTTLPSVHPRPVPVDCEALTRIMSPAINCWPWAVEGAFTNSSSEKRTCRARTAHLCVYIHGFRVLKTGSWHMTISPVGVRLRFARSIR